MYLGKEIHAGVSSPTGELSSLWAVGLSQWCLPLRENQCCTGDWEATRSVKVLKLNRWLSAGSDVVPKTEWVVVSAGSDVVPKTEWVVVSAGSDVVPRKVAVDITISQFSFTGFICLFRSQYIKTISGLLTLES